MPFGPQVGAEFGGTRCVGAHLPDKLSEQQLQEPHFDAVDALVFDVFGAAKRGQFGLYLGAVEDAVRARGARELLDFFDVEIQRISIKAADGQIGAGVVRLAVLNRVERVETDEADSEIDRGPVYQLVEIGEITAAPVAP